MNSSTVIKIEMIPGCDNTTFGHEEEFFPRKAHTSDAAYDIMSIGDYIISPGEVKLIPSGFKIQLPHGYEAQIRSRSGNALKRKLFVANSPGTIDSGYRGEVCVLLYNAGREEIEIRRKDKIAQMVICKLPDVELEIAESLDESDRGENGFGSTGLVGNRREDTKN